MKFSEHWLREWVNPELSTQELVERLTMAGLEVDSVESAAPAFQKVVVGQVLDVQPHPDADKLRVCTVDAGTGEKLQIVCGAPNVCISMKVPAALVGGRLPGDIKIKKAKLRGVESLGMLCSGRELGLSDDHDGIMGLPADAEVGRDFRELLDLDDSIIDIDLTPNRGDCLGIEGVAREVAALTGSPISRPDTSPVAVECDEKFPVEVLESSACPRYLGRVIRDIDPTATTPLWMQERLRRGGLRSLGPVVDVTNYVLLELGQPLHAFDLDTLTGGIRVRNAESNEKITLLDGNEVTLQADTLLISDHSKPLALAGIMGGEGSGVSASTTSLFLECAFFQPQAIAGKARRHGLQTDSSFRFERGVDPGLQHRALARTTQLLLELVGGKAGPVCEVASSNELPVKTSINVRLDRVNQVLGTDFSRSEVGNILQQLGAQVEESDSGWQVTAPSFRFDIDIEADLIEEVARIYGYNKLPQTMPSGPVVMAQCSESAVDVVAVQQALVARGYQEAITYSFVDADFQKKLDGGQASVRLANPISSEMSVMRTSLWPGMVQAALHNQHRQQNRIRLFETGLRFRLTDETLQQENMIAGLVTGDRFTDQWGEQSTPTDYFDVKADVETLLALGGRADQFSFPAHTHSALHPGRSARIEYDGNAVGWLGALHPSLVRELDFSSDVYLFEFEQSALQSRPVAAFTEISKFPFIRRDLAILVDRQAPSAKIRASVEDAAGPLLRELLIFDVYEGEGVEITRKSLALGLIIQDAEGTLTDKRVNNVIEQVTDRLATEFGAHLRE